MTKIENSNRDAAVIHGFKIIEFPKEFERNIWEDLDKRFYLIFFCSWLFV
jgi:hypothetical protein